MLKISSYYYRCNPEDHFWAWERDIGIGLPVCMAGLSNSKVNLVVITSDNYDVADESDDLSYCQIFAIPKKRPAKFVYSFLSDYIGNEGSVRRWIQMVRPNLLGCLHHLPLDLIQYGKSFGCDIKLIPWFITNVLDPVEKDVTAMCGGCVDPNIYPKRFQIYNYLSSLNRSDIILSGSTQLGKYQFSNRKYLEYAKKVKYYLSGGINDTFVPPKYYELASYGVCIVTFHMDSLKEVGFEHMKTCMVIKDINEIPEILNSDLYKTIGENARQMIEERHTVKKRAEEIIQFYRNLP